MTGVEVRRYVTAEQMQADITQMAGAGWMIVSQAEATGGPRKDLVSAGIIVAVIGFLVFLPLILVGIVLVVLGAVMQRRETVVTYRYAGQQPALG